MTTAGCRVPDDPLKDMLDAAASAVEDDLPRYRRILSAATRQVEPIHFQPVYGDFFWHCATTIPGWLPRVVVACAQTENSGSGALLEIWAQVDFAQEAECGLLDHAKDEARHSFMFLDLAQSVFGHCYQDQDLDSVRESLIKFSDRQLIKSENRINEIMLLDYLIQLNIVESRTRTHLSFLSPAYYGLAKSNQKLHVERLLNVLHGDEGKHIGYTAKLIDSMVDDRNIDQVTGVFACRLGDYNQHTLDHCDDAKNDYGQGRFPAFFD
jgi:hypothetical protein